MGAYLSAPVCTKVSEDGGKCPGLRFGASAMQGWRVSQEDAHCCLPDFDVEKDTSLFAVFDGHGGAEVAQYTAKHLPDFVKSLISYKVNDLAQALEESFLKFDATLTEESVVSELKAIAGDSEEENEEELKKDEEVLREEAEMSLDKILERYGGSENLASNKSVQALKKKDKFQSPVLRAKPPCFEKHAENNEEMSGDDKVKMKLEDSLLNGHLEENNIPLEGRTKDYPVSNGVCVLESGICQDKVPAESNEYNDTNLISCNSIKTTVKCSDSNCNDKLDKESNLSESDNSKQEPNSEVGSEINLRSESENDSKIEESGVPRDYGGDNFDDKVKLNDSIACIKKDLQSINEEIEQLEDECETLEGINSDAYHSESSKIDSPKEKKVLDLDVQEKLMVLKDQIMSLGAAKLSKRKKLLALKNERVKLVKIEKSSKQESSEESDENNDDDIDSDDDDDDEICELDEGEENAVMMGGGDEPGMDSGCTAVVALLRGNELYVANAGDSRCILCRDGKAIEMSIDHKPEDSIESDRIAKAGGRVTCDGRVNGGLNLSRAIGDHCYKQNKELTDKEQMITALPDVKSISLTDKDEFMVLACDGIWNVMSSQEVTDFVLKRLENTSGSEAVQLSKICEEMFDYCLSPDTSGDGTGCDNMTCIIVNLRNRKVGTNKRKAEDDVETGDSKRLKDGNEGGIGGVDG